MRKVILTNLFFINLAKHKMLSKIVRKIYGSYIPVVNIEGTINNIMYF